MRRSFLLFTLLLAAGLRFFRIGHQSYWNDEGNTLALTTSTWLEVVRAAAADIHPPGYYLVVKAWRLLTGESEFALRGFSALAGVALVALLYRLGREYFDERAALAAALLGAVNPFLIYYSQEARMYELLATLSAGSFWLFLLWLKSSRPPAAPIGNWVFAVGYCLISAAGLYTHYAFPFVLLAQNLAASGGLLAHRRGSGFKRLGVWLGLQLLTLLLFAPWLPTAYRQLTTWPAARESHSWVSSLADAARYLAFGRTVPTEQVWLALVCVGLLLILGLTRGGQTITPFLWLAVPAGLTLTLGLLTEAFSKFLLVAVPPLCLLLGNGVAGRRAQSAGRKWTLLGSWLLGFGILFATYFSLSNLYFDPAYFRDDYRGIARYVEGAQRPGDAIITIAPNQVQAFGYYHRPETGSAPVFPLPQTRPLDPAETTQALASIAASYSRVFVLFWGDEQADPEHVVENWLNTHAFKAGDQWYGQVRLATYAAARPAVEIATPSGARFGETITLQGYTLLSDAVAPGDIVQITLFWQTDRKLEERYKVFVHLYAALDQPPVAQHDGESGGGGLVTTEWPPGQTIADNHGVSLPADLPPGEYTLMLGLYHLFGGDRLPVTINSVWGGDRLELIKIRVK
jgi:hypothetical protein